MALGPTHEKLTYWAALIGAGAVAWIGGGFDAALTLGVFTVISGIWFNPDLDNSTIALKRWGILAFIWKSYATWIPHRSPLSHWPLIGTLGRLIYFGIAASLLILATILSIYAALTAIAIGSDVAQQQPIDLLGAVSTADYWMGAGWEAAENRLPGVDLRWVFTSPRIVAALVGMELGNSTHFGADQISTGTKRLISWFRPARKPNNPSHTTASAGSGGPRQ